MISDTRVLKNGKLWISIQYLSNLTKLKTTNSHFLSSITCSWLVKYTTALLWLQSLLWCSILVTFNHYENFKQTFILTVVAILQHYPVAKDDKHAQLVQLSIMTQKYFLHLTHWPHGGFWSAMTATSPTFRLSFSLLFLWVLSVAKTLLSSASITPLAGSDWISL